ncbi:MAG TPA: NAD(P)/FAD-dependent oxidoreductase [Polyangiaceae bacterium]|jgi:2-polyprenyl-6-methoxyphenol hydroxylase-like FAD-dependent oxidoreductase|nr:NAD(P)/FAD-dependent oxidoreductase [Polyangiaceae bacterium]
MKDMEACVVGGGPIGLFAAACLQERGVEVGVIDAEWERPVRSYACGLHPETLRQFDRLGLMPALQELAHRVDRVVVCDEQKRGTAIELAAVGGPFPHVLTLRQSDLQDLLAQRLAQLGVELALGQQVRTISMSSGAVHCVSVPQQRGAGSAANGAAALPPGDAIVRRAEYVIAADGFDSVGRRALGVEFMDAKRSEAFAIFEFEADLSELQHEAYVVLGADSVSAFWPLGPSLGRWTFQIWEQLDETPSLEALQQLLAERAPWFRPRPEQLGWVTTSSFERRIARRFGSDRLWLAGDAAHVTTPIGFQSMNRGFVEVSVLAELISNRLRGEAEARGFQRFEREQQREWRRLLGLGTTPLPGWLTSADQARLAPCLPASGVDLDTLLGELSPSLWPQAPAASSQRTI